MDDDLLQLNGKVFQVASEGTETFASVIKNYLAQKGLPDNMALTFDDVTILDFKSDIPSRSSITDTRARLARDIFLNTPIVSANMDTITESRMAVAPARLGGLGV